MRNAKLTGPVEQNSEPEFFCNLDHARDVLLLLRSQRADFLEEFLKARRRDDTHEPAGRLAEVTIGVRNPARRKNRRALFGDDLFLTDPELEFALENLKRLIFTMMNMGGGPPPGTSCDSTTLTTPLVSRPWMRMKIGMPQDADPLAAIFGDLDWVHIISKWRRCSFSPRLLASPQFTFLEIFSCIALLTALILNHMVKCSSRLLNRTFAALADPTRRRFFEHLAHGDRCVTDLARPYSMSLPAVSKHLRVLENAGSFRRRRNGRVHR